MTRCLTLSLSLLLFGTVEHRGAQTTLTEGQALARDMRHTQLLNHKQISGALKTKGRRGKRSLKTLQLHTALLADHWQSSFAATDPVNKETTILQISRSPSERPRYFLGQTGETETVESLDEISPSEAMQPFAGTDFWIADLGLEFFYWPEQRLLKEAKIKMRKGISCFVPQSERPAPDATGYSRVRSWISRDHGGLIYAEAYASDGQRVKTFEVADVEKIEGEWRIKELRIRDAVARSTTELVFYNQ